MQVVIGDLISLNPTTFVQSQSHTISFWFMIWKILLKRGARKACLKIKLRNVVDIVVSDFFYDAFWCLGFGETWIGLVKSCVGSLSFSILNSSLPGFIKSNRGLRLRDPLSSYLFARLSDLSTILLELAIAEGNIKLSSSNNPKVSHFIFADSLLVLCKDDDSQILWSFHWIHQGLWALH